MVETEASSLTAQDLVVLLREGHSGVEANVARTAFNRIVDEWENDPDRSQKLETLRDSSVGVGSLVPQARYDQETEQFYLGPNKAPGILNDTNPSPVYDVAEEFAAAFFEAHSEVYQELLDGSTLTKNQFLVYLMKEAGAPEDVIAHKLDLEVGTVRSHAGRAREKVKAARRTVRIPELFTVESSPEPEAEMNELLEPRPA
jgi:DNA-directed RNA polymerase specialized sigma24 family protein